MKYRVTISWKKYAETVIEAESADAAIIRADKEFDGSDKGFELLDGFEEGDVPTIEAVEADTDDEVIFE